MTWDAATLGVLTAASTLAATVKGCTGFGSGIINMTVWAVCKAMGIPSGTLQQAVLVESLSGVASAVPLVLLTRAWRTADWQIVGVLGVSGALGAPLGAVLLTRVDPRAVEAFLAATLAAVVVLQSSAWAALAARLPHLRSRLWRLLGRHTATGYLPVASCDGGFGDVAVAPGQAAAIELPLAPPHAPADVQSPPKAAAAGAVDLAAGDAVQEWHQAGEEGLPFAGHQCSSHQPSSSSTAGAGQLRPADDVAAPQGQKQRTWPHVLMVGVVWWGAGLASGVMGALTGVNGPPWMALHAHVNTPKDIVRGSNAVLNVFQVRVVFYVFMGQYSAEDVPMYVVAVLLSLVGLLVGHSCASRIDQRGFIRLLTALMVLCCLLMAAAASGLVAST